MRGKPLWERCEGIALRPDLDKSPLRSESDRSRGQLVSMAIAERSYILKVPGHAGGKIAGEGGAAEIVDTHPNTLRARTDKIGIL